MPLSVMRKYLRPTLQPNRKAPNGRIKNPAPVTSMAIRGSSPRRRSSRLTGPVGAAAARNWRYRGHRDRRTDRRLSIATVPDRRLFDRVVTARPGSGIVPRQDSTGGKHKLGPISKQGDRYLRRILVLGAHAVLRRARQQPEKYPWLDHASACIRWAKEAFETENRVRVGYALHVLRVMTDNGSCYRSKTFRAACKRREGAAHR